MGKHYNYFRDYEPGTGGYLESDPIGLSGGWNTYSYVYNSPLNYIDPKGQAGVLPLLCGTNPWGWAACGCVAVGTSLYFWARSGNRNSSSVSTSIDFGETKPFVHTPAIPDYKSCSSGDDCDDREKRRKGCQDLKDSFLKTCAGLTGRKMFNCFHAADDAFDQCMAD